jgi:hypothetical protein
MPKLILEDIKINRNIKNDKEEPVLNNRRDIQIDLSKNHDINKHIVIEKYFTDNNFKKKEKVNTSKEIKKRTYINKKILITFILLIIFSILYFGQNIFNKVDIYIKTKKEIINYKNQQFVAKKNQNTDSIIFTLLIYPEKKYKKIQLTDNKEVSQNAEGIVTIFNEYSMNPQKIIPQTFLSDDEGKAYLTQELITIPGYKSDNGKIIPGQIDVRVKAFLPGSNYNGEPENFYINAFKGNVKFNKIYGKLKQPMRGGALGLVYFLNDNDKDNLNKIINNFYRDELFLKVKASIPPGYLLYDDASDFSYSIEDTLLYDRPEADIEINEILSVILIEKNSLIAGIVKKSLPLVSKYNTNEIIIPRLDQLDFDFSEENKIINKEINDIKFNLTGELNVIWRPNIDELKNKLIGLKKDQSLAIFKQEEGIASAIVKFFPPWQKFFPENISKINIFLDNDIDY